MTANRPDAARPGPFEVRVPVATMWTRPEAPRHVDSRALLDEPDVPAWADSMDAPTRKELNGRTLTQLLLGEPVEVLEERGDWVRAVALRQPSSAHPAGYPGWMRRRHLGAPADRAGDRRAVVTARAATCDVQGGGRLEVSFGTELAVESLTARAATVLLPDARRGSVAVDCLSLRAEQAALPEGRSPLDSAAQFLGLRYLWGGTSTWGMDCSGLVHLVFRALGVTVPRDAFDQAAWAEPLPLDEVEPGDLYFFARPGERVYHVGFVSRAVGAGGERWMLHAPEGGGRIEDSPLAPHRTDTLVSAGRVRTGSAGGPWIARGS